MQKVDSWPRRGGGLFLACLALAVLLLVSLPSAGVFAQQDLTLAAVQVEMWPEYDRPNMLVLYDIVLPAQVSLPVDLSIRIPAEAGAPNALAARQPNGELFTLTYEQQPAGDWTEIQFTATTIEVRLEYYDPRLVKEGAERHFEYQWPGDYAVDSMVVRVQQPLGASNMRLTPTLGNGVPAGDGLVYYTAEVGSLTAGQTFAITMDYTKPNDDLSVSNLPVVPSAPIDEAQTDRMNVSSILPWVLGGLGLLLIIGGGVWYWRSGREDSGPARRTRRRAPASQRSKASEAPSADAPAEHIYCHQCGKRAAPGDRFCRTCGTQLRTQ